VSRGLPCDTQVLRGQLVTGVAISYAASMKKNAGNFNLGVRRCRSSKIQRKYNRNTRYGAAIHRYIYWRLLEVSRGLPWIEEG
jgi:hypothetical protein